MSRRRLRFGVITFGVHPPEQDPALQLADDLALAEHADRLGLDEMWWCEHRSGGWQIGADPMLMVARAAATTHRIRLGAHVTTLAAQQPKLLLDGAVQLDHLTRGRLMLGVGTPTLVGDAAMLGLDPQDAQAVLTESLSVMVRLLDGGAPVSMVPRRAPWLLREASLQLLPYAEGLDLRVSALRAPEDAALAGRFATGMLSFAASQTSGLGRTNALKQTWLQASSAADRYGRAMPRERWSAISPMHLAASEIQARREVREGIVRYWEYMRDQRDVEVPSSGDVDTIVDALHAGGHAVVGTPAMAVEHLERVLELSGGIGTFLVEHTGWANPADSAASFELLAREVVPRFTGSVQRRQEAAARERARAPYTVPAPARRAAAPEPHPHPAATPARGVTRAPHQPAAPPSSAPTAGSAPSPDLPLRRRGRHAIDPE